jgi:nitroimidazol reductase NimA-like FMN-containing flavoprotein (pyridoxamine 5'-phosphate oxidase superfamily)
MTIDALEAYGMEQMDDQAVRDFLETQRTGVLGLPAADAPLLVPMSFGFDGESTLLFTFVVGGSSRKRRLADRADSATFLVYSLESAFNWQSVSLTGPITAVPETEWDEYAGVLDSVWRPSLFESATADRTVAVYRLEIAEQVGIRHTGLPDGFDKTD